MTVRGTGGGNDYNMTLARAEGDRDNYSDRSNNARSAMEGLQGIMQMLGQVLGAVKGGMGKGGGGKG